MPVTKVCLAIFSLAIVCIYTLGLGNFPLTERSEARYAGVAWEMLRSGDCMTPRFNDIKHFHKPPLFYWVTALSMKLLGPTEGAARLPNALAALATLALTASLARRPTMNCPNWWLATACLATAPFFWEMGRIAVTDMLVCLFVTSALLAAWNLIESGPSSRKGGAFLVFWVSLGLGFLTKGPVGPLIVALVVIPYLWRTGSSWRVFRPLPGLAVAAALGLPWYLWVVSQNQGLLQYFFGFQTLDRVFSTVHRRAGPVWFYLPVLLGGFLPWSLWLPGALKSAAGNARRPEPEVPNPDLFLLLWLFVPLLFFSMIGSKLPPYVLPLFPAMALLVGRHLSIQIGSKLAAPLWVFAIAALAGFAQSCWGFVVRLGTFASDLRLAAFWLTLGCAGGLMATRQRREATLVASMVATMLGLLLLATMAFNKLAYLSAEGMARSIRAHAQGDFEVAMYRRYLFGLPYYLNQNIIHVGFEREVQFETDNHYRALLYPSLDSYMKVFRQGDKTRFLVVSIYEWPEVKALPNESVVYRDDRYMVLKHQAGAALRP